MTLERNRLPDAESFFESRGLRLKGRGKWRTTRCDFHGGSDSMRVNTDSGAWVCMSCGVKGGDVVAYDMQRDGVDFVAACKSLGAWVDDDKRVQQRPRAFTAADALAALHVDLHLCTVVVSDARRGVIPSEDDWRAFLGAAGRVIKISQEFRV